MKKSFALLTAVTALLIFGGCSDKQHQVKTADIEAGEIDVDHISYFCVDGVRYIKYDDDDQFGVTVKFNKDGSVDTNCTTEK